MKGIIDRFEGEYAVVEFDGRQMKDIPLALIPGEAREGDVIAEVDGKYVVDKEETENRKKQIQDLTKDMWAE